MEFGILSLLPPLLAILLALMAKNVIPALFAGVWIGATMVNGWNPFTGFYATFTDFIIPSVGNPGNATILIYCGFFGGLIAVLQKTGGAYAVAQAIAKKVKSSRGAQASTSLFGVIIFFEDYFNALTVGSVMRPVTDRLKVSREKLAYIVDSTSAPMCLLGPVSTWVVFLMGLIGAEFTKLEMSGSTYVAYLKTIPYNFYAILALILVFVTILSKVEFGPMAKAQHRAQMTGRLMRDGAAPPSSREITEMEPIEGTTPRIKNMLIPIIVLLVLIPPMFLWTGGYPENDFLTAIGESNGGVSILIAAVVAGVVGLALGIGQKMFGFNKAFEIYVAGIKGMTMVYIILTLAWSLGSVTDVAGTADYVIQFVQETTAPQLVPALLFLFAAVIAFTTGTSYGTFAIMIPIAVPLAVSLDLSIYPAIAAVLSGGIFGDHSSPISDTTILSSAGSTCDHIDHVNTQIPYAVLAGVSGLVSFLIVGYTGSILLALLISIIVMVVLAFVLTRIWGVSKFKDSGVSA